MGGAGTDIQRTESLSTAGVSGTATATTATTFEPGVNSEYYNILRSIAGRRNARRLIIAGMVIAALYGLWIQVGPYVMSK